MKLAASGPFRKPNRQPTLTLSDVAVKKLCAMQGGNAPAPFDERLEQWLITMSQ